MKRFLSLFMSVLMVFSCFAGSITTAHAAVNSPIPGDINGDGNVNTKDLTRLLKFVSGEDVEVIAVALDANGDGNVNTKDLSRLMGYLAGDPVKELAPIGCSHEMTATPASEATCTAEGNIAYWYCSKCEKYFSDAEGAREITLEETVVAATGHNYVTVEGSGYPATVENPGKHDDEKCANCGDVKEGAVIPINEYAIEYVIGTGDEYLSSLNHNGKVDNGENPTSYSPENGVPFFDELVIPGYRFEGWYDGSGTSAVQVKRIAPNTMTGKIKLYARLVPIESTITFSSKFISVAPITNHQVNKESSLPAADVMKLPGYRWLGWSDENGDLYDGTYPVGKAGHVTLYANWQSYRNQAVPKKLEEPKVIVNEEEGQYLFTFDLGEIRNVPILEVADYGKLIPGSPKEVTTTTETISLTNEEAKEFAETVSNATTKTTAWTLSNEWNTISSVSESHASEMGIDVSKINYDFESTSSQLALSSDAGASTNETVNWGVNAKVYGKNTTEVGAEAKFPVKCLNVGVSAKNTTEIGGEINGYYDNTTVNDSYWNTKSSYNGSHETINSTTTTQNLSQHVSDVYNYSTTNSQGGSQTEEEAVSIANTKSEEYATLLAYTTNTITAREVQRTYTAEHEGWWRQVIAGTVHVIGVVSYDIKTSTYSVYTYNVLDEKTSMFMDFSMESDEFNDYETGVIPFEIPYSVNEFVSTTLGYSDGLKVNNYGKVTEYTGDAEHVHIPDFMTFPNGDGTSYTFVKVTGIEEGVFANKTNITSVRLSKYITEIPDNTFNGCSSLKTVEQESVTAIGESAFRNCISLQSFKIDPSVEVIGKSAFENIPGIVVYAKDSSIVNSSINSGAKSFEIYLKEMDDKIGNTVIAVPSTAEYFAIYGRDKNEKVVAYSNLVIDSMAKTTVVNGMTFVDNTNTPLRIDSENVVFEQVNVENAPGFALVLSGDTTKVSLRFENVFSTTGTSPIIGKNIVIEEVPGTTSTNKIYAEGGKLFYCGTFTDNYKLFVGEKEKINEESFEQMLNDSLPWILESDLPEGATVVGEKWIYDKRTDIESDTDFVEGYTLYDTKSEWSDYGPWSPWSKTAVTKTDYIDVETKTIAATYKTQYNYSRYTQNNNNTGWNGPVAGTWSGVYCQYYFERGWSDSRLSSFDSQSSGQYGGTFYLYGSYNDTWYNERTRSVVVTPAYTEYRYRVRSLIYTYYHTKTENLESETEITSADAGENETISNIQKWVRYVSK